MELCGRGWEHREYQWNGRKKTKSNSADNPAELVLFMCGCALVSPNQGEECRPGKAELCPHSSTWRNGQREVHWIEQERGSEEPSDRNDSRDSRSQDAPGECGDKNAKAGHRAERCGVLKGPNPRWTARRHESETEREGE